MNQILVVDAGGQYCHLIARRIREAGVKAIICQPNEVLQSLQNAKGVVISGGPNSVYEPGAPSCPSELFDAGIPILGICYGHQMMAHHLGGSVQRGVGREYGDAELRIIDSDTILSKLNTVESVWMSHGDEVIAAPPGFQVLAETDTCKVAAMSDVKRRFYGLQFHPEVTHTSGGKQIIENFLRACSCEKDWSVESQLPGLMNEIRATVGDRSVLFFVSGGVDSTVAFTLCTEVLGPDRVLGVFVDTGCMRKGEGEQIEGEFSKRGWQNIKCINASDAFLRTLAGVVDPEEKRKRIGEAFLDVQQQVFADRGFSSSSWMLGQGTIYPDTIESGKGGTAATIKTHHNRVPAIEELERQGLVLEPLRSFYKDEVRSIGRELGLPSDLVDKHPFPGPGLAVRCLCSSDDHAVLKATEVVEIASEAGLDAWSVRVRTVGVQGDSRSYSDLVVLKGSKDLNLCGQVSTQITRSVSGTNRVVVLLGSNSPIGTEPRVSQAWITKERLDMLREADAICMEMLKKRGLTDEVWQFPVILLPLTFGVGETIALRPVCSTDGMTAQFAKLPSAFVDEVASLILEVPGIGAVVYDVTNKPPATIEWE